MESSSSARGRAIALAAVGGMMAAVGGCGATAPRDAVASVEVPKEAPPTKDAPEPERARPRPSKVEKRAEHPVRPPEINLDDDDTGAGFVGGVMGGVVGGTVGGVQGCCKGFNDCKGKGNCKTDKHDCKGKNDCKGKGGCRDAVCP